jgi:hypothetical protein
MFHATLWGENIFVENVLGLDISSDFAMLPTIKEEKISVLVSCTMYTCQVKCPHER